MNTEDLKTKYQLTLKEAQDIQIWVQQGKLSHEEAARMIIRMSRGKEIKKLMKYFYDTNSTTSS